MKRSMIETAFPNGPSRDPGVQKPLTLSPPPSCAVCPDCTQPRHALLCAAAVERKCRLDFLSSLAVDKENRLVLRLIGTLETLDTVSGAWYIQQQYWRADSPG